MITVSKKRGEGQFTDIQSAVDSILTNNEKENVIYIKSGIYKEKLNINKPNITFIGEDKEKTVVTYDDGAFNLFPDGEKFGTFNSYSVYVDADDFKAENITFENSAGPGEKAGQAIAVYVDGDRAVFKNCSFLGCQDTLFTAPLPLKERMKGGFKGPGENKERKHLNHYFESCYIKGDIDFIFGSATAVFNKCTIFSNDRGMETNGYITAASTPQNQEFGYVFIDCKLLSSAKPHTVYLGRPWRKYANVVFIKCYMGDHIKPEGWCNFTGQNDENTVYFAEYKNYGPGADMSRRVSWINKLTDQEAKKYTIRNIFSEKNICK